MMFNERIYIFCYRTPSRALPKINGKEIDLYLLYVLVTAQGGWVKVSLFHLVMSSFYLTSIKLVLIRATRTTNDFASAGRCK